MTRHYSTRDFFRQMPNALLARYFHARGPFVDLDFSAMKETNPHELFEMSCKKGFRAIIDEAE